MSPSKLKPRLPSSAFLSVLFVYYFAKEYLSFLTIIENFCSGGGMVKSTNHSLAISVFLVLCVILQFNVVGQGPVGLTSASSELSGAMC